MSQEAELSLYMSLERTVSCGHPNCKGSGDFFLRLNKLPPSDKTEPTVRKEKVCIT